MSVRSGGLASTSKPSGGGTGVPNRLLLAAKSGTHYLCTKSTYDITPPESAHNTRQKAKRVVDDENGGASRGFEGQGDPSMILTQQYPNQE